MIAVIPEVAFFADFGFRGLFEPEVLNRLHLSLSLLPGQGLAPKSGCLVALLAAAWLAWDSHLQPPERKKARERLLEVARARGIAHQPQEIRGSLRLAGACSQNFSFDFRQGLMGLDLALTWCQLGARLFGDLCGTCAVLVRYLFRTWPESRRKKSVGGELWLRTSVFLGILPHAPDSRTCLFNKAYPVEKISYKRITANATSTQLCTR